ncbi:MAG TPA: caspase family protein [Phycisphaerales bacterium]|nr:caspase family protein [Phycisphaerales bacterium]
MRKALVVGINFYQHGSPLYGCVDDAYAMKGVLEEHSDGSVNFDVKLLSGTGPTDLVTRNAMKDAARELFADDSEVALFYFAGHGHIETTGGYLLTSECRSGDDGLPLGDLLTFANESKARNRVIVLDSCHSGIAGARPTARYSAELSEGLTILTASTADQYATEDSNGGVFTNLFVDAMKGPAADLIGNVTPGGVYAHIDQSLGMWEQRPVFKTNVKRFVSLRKVQPCVSLSELQRITEFFPSAGHQYPLDPSFEPRDEGRTPGMPRANPENNRKFAVLQKFNRVNLVVPVDTPHMWNAAMESKACRLTALGEHYRRLRSKGRF